MKCRSPAYSIARAGGEENWGGRGRSVVNCRVMRRFDIFFFFSFIFLRSIFYGPFFTGRVLLERQEEDGRVGDGEGGARTPYLYVRLR